MDINEKNFDTIEDLDIIKEEEIDFSNKEEIKVQGVQDFKSDLSNAIAPSFNKIGAVENNFNEPINPILPNEIGRVKNIAADSVLISITSKKVLESNLVDQHVIFKNNQGNSIVGIVLNINDEMASIRLIGEISAGRFVAGVLTKPSIGNVCFIATEEEMKLIVSDNKNEMAEKKVLIGSMPLYNNTLAYVSTNTMFSNHFSIFGNSGSGKSCGVARLFQNVFFNAGQPTRNACVFIFDAYGEYESALSVPNSQINFKRYSTNVRGDKSTLIKLPLWLLDLDDFALLLDVDDPTQLPIIEKALRLVTIFSGEEKETRVYKNDIIAKAILEVLYSGGNASQIHDQIFAILTSFNTPDLNLETPIMQPGYTRSLRQC